MRGVGLAGAGRRLRPRLAFGGAITAIQSTTVANAVFLFAASPFLTALLGWAILRERVAPETWAAIAVALVGIFVMVREGLEGGALAGNVAGLLSSLGFAAFTVSLRWRRVDDTLPTVLSGSLFSLAAGAARAGHRRAAGGAGARRGSGRWGWAP